MAVLEVYEYPHPVLKKKAVKVEKVDDALRKLMDDMLETMYSAVGVGLAAPQIGQSVRVLVIDYEQEEDENGNRIKGNPRYFVNPEIIWHSDEKVCGEEGCLSVPDQRAEVERHAQVRVHYLDYEGKVMDEIYEHLKVDNHPLSTWFYAHFHASKVEYISGIRFQLLNILELMQVR